MAVLEPCFLSVAEAAEQIRQHALTALDLARSCVAEIDRIEPEIRAWVTIDREGVLREAATLDREARDGRFRGLLHGIPLGIKDVFYTAGMRTTGGHAPMANFVPEFDSAVVERLRRAGAIVLGKTTTTEYALIAPTPTRNPWNTEHTPGGSSSGSGAAVAARMCLGAIGTQTGGSTIRPAAYCGVVGFKPTHGRISCFGMIPLAQSTDCPGMIVRSVADIAPMLQVLAGYDARDHTSALVPVDDYLGGSRATIAEPRLALMMGGEFLDKSNDEVRANVKATADKFARAGARIDEVEPPPSLADMSEAFWRVLAAEAAAHHREEIERHPEGFDSRTRELLEKGLAMPAMKYLRALAVRREFRRDVTEILHHYDAVLVPSVPTPAPLGLDSTGDPVFNNPWSMAGNPVVGLPSGLSASGLPLAVQIVGGAFGESRLLALARWCEGVLAFAEMPALVKA
jgi:Asp-tRNA(Asn)/Glu-tRNA(Gln) amidotransferase A subunit family amidase